MPKKVLIEYFGEFKTLAEIARAEGVVNVLYLHVKM